MKYLIDTCVISELVARKPDERVVSWLDGLDPNDVFLSVITIGEIGKGVEKLPASPRREALQEWLENDLLNRFRGRIPAIDEAVMLTLGRLVGRLEADGRKMPAIDSLVAALALHGNFHLVTRNEDDFRYAGITIVNPWRFTGGAD